MAPSTPSQANHICVSEQSEVAGYPGHLPFGEATASPVLQDPCFTQFLLWTPLFLQLHPHLMLRVNPGEGGDAFVCTDR